MSTTELEKQNLEAHVDLCSERYKGLHDRLSAIEVRLAKMNEDMSTVTKAVKDNHSNSRHGGRRPTINSGSDPDEDARLNYQYMFIRIAPKATVYVTDTDVEFIRKHALESFRSDQLSQEDADRAKTLADKAVFVRKKLDTHAICFK